MGEPSTLAAMLLRLLRQEKGALLQEEEILDEKSIAVDLGTGEDIYKGSTPIVFATRETLHYNFFTRMGFSHWSM